ncbi:hypothetical protein SAICODRAFT_35222 [Saitoella complicata NRRL Y-17804]|uniref:uncharacterized protein n=1 Tax=Saitoella complicata (strain BCRC 22490 / CBS 7301 / JCM 7358 / NBRC 10748 / NRRL Y-17804) TaxID=698492 RepID=UPI0008675A19|nr:uncharacterized protein SAICODRAFT_35222 [Saitoella complicata NRRL Y-17804]ODQ52962.1 hypothetical protein SAICODRAFT_35222 [Saitoella complicata NRRL Y-17804]
MSDDRKRKLDDPVDVQSTFTKIRKPDTPEGRRSETPNGNKEDAAAKAAAAAARINAMLAAKAPEASKSADAAAGEEKKPAAERPKDIYVQDDDYIKDIEINDLRNRYLLTKGSTQSEIKQKTGADVTTRGKYYPDKSMATERDPPLYLHITSRTREGLEQAIEEVNQLMNTELPSLIDERRLRRFGPRPDEPGVERDEFGRRKWPEEKVYIGMESMPGFNVRAQVVGPQGAYVKHIQGETRMRVQIKGQGSGFIEQAIGREADEPMFLHITGPDAQGVQRAKEMCEDLLKTVKDAYEQHKLQPRQQYNDRGHGGGRDYNRQHSQGQSQSQGYGTPGASSASPAPSAAAGGASGAADPYAAYANGQDPYAAYGGYQAYMAYYYQYYAAAQQQAAAGGAPGAEGATAGAATGAGAGQDYAAAYAAYYQQQAAAASPQPPAPGGAPGAPPAPGTDSQPPPPPPGAAPGTGSYGAVPPPPGL